MNKLMTIGDNYSFSLKEGKYSDFEVGSIVALDKDEGDLGRVEYFLIGTSQQSLIKQPVPLVSMVFLMLRMKRRLYFSVMPVAWLGQLLASNRRLSDSR